MKKILVFIVCSIALLGCAKAPESEVVVQKDNDQLEAAIAEANQSKSEGSLQTSETSLGTYEDTFVGAEDKVKVEVCADVMQTYPAPVVRVRPYEITSEDAKKWAELLFDGTTVYEPSTVITKRECEELILQYRQILGDEDYFLENYGENPSLMEEVKEEYQKLIDFYQEKYDTAPEKYERVKCRWEFHPWSYYEYDSDRIETEEKFELDGTQILRAVGEGEYQDAELQVANRDRTDYQSHSIEFRWDNYQKDPLIMTENEACAITDEFVATVGLETWHVFSVEKCISYTEDGEQYFYRIEYENSYEGMDEVRQPFIDLKSEDTYAAHYDYESLVFNVSNGKIVYVSWDSPLEVLEVEAQSVELMPFSEISDRFRSQMQMEYSLRKAAGFADDIADDDEAVLEYDSATIRISSVRLGLVRVKIKDEEQEFRLVPAWSFQGEVGLESHGMMEWFSELEGVTLDDYWRTYETINAIDGSRIDVILGY